MAYSYIDGNNDALYTIAKDNQIKQVLHWIGFRDNAQKNSIFNDSINSYSNLYSFTPSDIADMAKDYTSHIAANEQIHFSVHCIKKLKAFAFWVQDFWQINKMPTIEGINWPNFWQS